MTIMTLCKLIHYIPCNEYSMPTITDAIPQYTDVYRYLIIYHVCIGITQQLCSTMDLCSASTYTITTYVAICAIKLK